MDQNNILVYFGDKKMFILEQVTQKNKYCVTKHKWTPMNIYLSQCIKNQRLNVRRETMIQFDEYIYNDNSIKCSEAKNTPKIIQWIEIPTQKIVKEKLLKKTTMSVHIKTVLIRWIWKWTINWQMHYWTLLVTWT